jgi:hypothetical protein
MLSHLVYVSTASEPMGEEDLAALLEQSRARNERNGITGMLLYKNGRFIQLLEGQEESVLKVFDSIRRDERHHDVELLWLRYALYREFPDWTMGFQNVDELDPETLRGFTPFLDRDIRYENFLENSTDVHAMLLAFRENPQAFA